MLSFYTACKKAAFMLAAIALTACGGGSSGPTTTANTNESTNITQTQTIFSGQVYDTGYKPVRGVLIQIADQSITTGVNGTFSFTLPNTNAEVMVLAKKNGYVTSAKQVPIFASKTTDLQIQIFEYQAKDSFAATVGADITTNGARLQIPANAVKTSAGAAYTGTVTMLSGYFDPDSIQGVRAFQQPYTGISSVGSAQVSNLLNVGMLEVKLTDSDDNALQLDAAKPATLIYPSSSVAAGTDSMPLWYYDEANRAWLREGQVSKKANGFYQGSVTRMGVWSVNIPVNNTAILKGCFVDSQNNPVTNVSVIIRSQGWSKVISTGSDSKFEFSKVPAAQALEISSNVPSFVSFAIPALAVNESRSLACIVVTPVSANILIVPPIYTFESDTPTQPNTASLAGSYTGSFSGIDSGTFSVVITTNGTANGILYSQIYKSLYPLTGVVRNNGQVDWSTGVGARPSPQGDIIGVYEIIGGIAENSVLSGQWRYKSGSSGGNLKGQR